MRRFFLVGLALAIGGSIAQAQAPNTAKPVEKVMKLVDKAQMAVLLKSDNSKMTVILVSLDSKELLYKLTATEKPRTITAKTGFVKAIQIQSGEMFARNPKTAAFEPFDPLTNTFTVAAKAIAKEDAKAIAKEDAKAIANEDAKAIANEEGSPKDTKKPQTEKVVAEGVGATGDDALKDAFRNAVRQVVGAVVDAETLIKNDEVISDKVLTYSDGFITKYDEISKKVGKGLIRIKIAASVERRSVIAKLREAKVSVREVDGKGLFAEAVTGLEAEKNAEEILTKALTKFPLNCLVAEVVGKPELLNKGENEATILVTVRLRSNIEGYDVFAKRIQESLKGVAKKTGEFVMAAKINQESEYNLNHDRQQYSKRAFWAATLFGGTNDTSLHGQYKDPGVVVVLNTQRSKILDRTVWRSYLLDGSTRRALAATTACVFDVKLSLLGKEDVLIAVDTFPARSDPKVKRFWNHYHASLVSPGLLGDYFSSNSGKSSGFFPHVAKRLEGSKRDGAWEGSPERVFILAPFFFGYSDTAATYVTSLVVERRITVSLDDLKAIQSITCEVVYDGDLPPPIEEGDKRNKSKR